MNKDRLAADRLPPLTETEALQYVLQKDIPARVWGKAHNRPMFAFVRASDLPTDRTFRNEWRLATHVPANPETA